MNKQFKNIAISGSSSGLGAALSEKFSGSDTHLFLAGRNEARLNQVADKCKENGSIVKTAAFDIGDEFAVQAWIDEIEQKYCLDLVICNAGITESRDDDESLENPAKSRSVIETNLLGTISLTYSAARHMINRKKGHIVMISSISGMQPLADAPSYGASKAGVIAYAEAMHAYLSEHKIDISVICPGYVNTPMGYKFAGWRPFEISADRAASKIYDAIGKRRSFYAFPWQLVFGARLGKLLPWGLRRHTTKSFRYKRQI